MQPYPLILASASPRRAELLRAMGLTIDVITSNAEEIDSGEPTQLAIDNAFRKAQAVHADHPDAWVLGADTIVVLDNKVYGKPRDYDDAVRIITALQGRPHEVVTGVSLAACDRVYNDYERTQVIFAPMSEREIAAYLATGESMDKAGAYGIQGMMRMFVESIHGSYDNVMGLPTALVRRMLNNAGFVWF
ncbi:Maf-like protein [Clostridia bacterium]|nr:Maf-like protein [Clostridia bacterium]